MKGFGLLLDRREMIGAGFEDLAHLIHRHAGVGQFGHSPLARQHGRDVGHPARLLLVGAIELDDGGGGIGRGFGNLHHFLVARQFTGEKRIGEHLLERHQRLAALALQILRINLVNRGELENELHRQRPLVAFDQVEIRRRNAQRLGHRRLG